MRISKSGLDTLKSLEGCKLLAYKDIGGVWTIGYGHTEGLIAASMPIKITADTAIQFLLQDLKKFEDGVNDLVINHTITQGNFDALVLFSYNIGLEALKKSTLLKKFNAGDKPGAEREFLKWVTVKGKLVNGLVNRRKKEIELFIS